METHRHFLVSVISSFGQVRIMYYSSVKVVSWVTKDFEHEVLGRASSAELTCRAAKLSGLCKLTVLMMSYWIVVCVSVVSALCLTIVAGSQQNMWQCISLAATLWLPGFVWTYRYHCFLLGRKCVGIGAILGLPVCVLSWCCGVIWLWAPAAVMLWSVLFPLAPSCKLMCLLLRVSGCHSWDPPYPIQTQSFTLYEIYARDLQMWGDAPRVLLVIGMHISSFPPSNDTWSFLDVTVISSSLLSLVFSLVPFRRRLRRETWQYFDETIMELVSD
ncbi:unnamed protein product [Durusdinium trenchii]|uniref:Uncharacterized protein n=1 Tax=Durusdinium trenchii TaxID=1381693 RepID=A0ABP0PFJ8_9DINO